MSKRAGFSAKPRVVAFVFYLLASGIILIFSTGTFAFDFKAIGFSLISGIQIGVQKTISLMTQTFTSAKELANLRVEYKALAEKMADYENLHRSNAEIKKENLRLREQLGFVETLTKKNIPAMIIGRDASNRYSAITINKGVRDGVRKNMQVIAFQNGNVGLVGKVVEVGRFTSMVILIYDFQFNVSTRVQTTREIGLSTGRGSAKNGLSMQHIRKTSFENLHYGDLIVTSGESSSEAEGFEREIPVGTISHIEIVDYNTSLNIEIAPIIDFNRLETVVVVSNENLQEE